MTISNGHSDNSTPSDHAVSLVREVLRKPPATIIRERLTNDFITGETVSIDGGMTMRIA